MYSNCKDCSVENGHCGLHPCVEIQVRDQIITECVCIDGFESSTIYHQCKGCKYLITCFNDFKYPENVIPF